MKKVKYITIMACVAAGLFSACNDDFVPNKNSHNSNVVGFTLSYDDDNEKKSRSNEKQHFCGVLPMTNGENSQDSLYLHSSVMDTPAPEYDKKV